MNYHVSLSGNDGAQGTASSPFCTISRAAALAMPGDTVTVHAGIYREWVNPANGGTESERIVYESAGDGEVVITGAEPIPDWKDEGGGVWSAEVSNEIFAVRNPYSTLLFGDWLIEPDFPVHLGDVYLDGKSLYECDSIERLASREPWPQAKYPGDSLYRWYAKVGEKSTQFWVFLDGKNPRKENVEINARPYCFWPSTTGCGYITVRGFTLRQASPQWAPPTALQEGLIGPHWSRGWIIENNIICESKCAGISLGKDLSTGQNEWSRLGFKGGTQREQEVIFRALRSNWNKEEIGGHIVQENIIHDCEQAGIVGHLGGAFSKIIKNRIYNIHHKRLFHGAEVGGIKLHASIDVVIRENIIHSSYRALWLDWQAQGTRISKNVFFDNLSEDLFVEVCHGPYLIDHNLFLSPMSFRNMAQGGAFAHNLFAGRFVVCSELTRYTPYHVPHDTDVAGYANITGGDDRFINNVFLGDGNSNDMPDVIEFFEHLPLSDNRLSAFKPAAPVMDGVPDRSNCKLYPVGLGGYNSYPDASRMDQYQFGKAENPESNKQVILYAKSPLPMLMKDNVYLHNALPGSHEPSATREQKQCISISTDRSLGEICVAIESPESLTKAFASQVNTAILGHSHHAEMAYEEADGTPICLNSDFFGTPRTKGHVTPGPFELQGNERAVFIIKI